MHVFKKNKSLQASKILITPPTNNLAVQGNQNKRTMDQQNNTVDTVETNNNEVNKRHHLDYDGFKIFNLDWTCQNIQYEVGKTSEHLGSIVIRTSGLHFCESPLSCLSYYPGAFKNPEKYKYAYVKDVGSFLKRDKHRDVRVTDKLYIAQEISVEMWTMLIQKNEYVWSSIVYRPSVIQFVLETNNESYYEYALKSVQKKGACLKYISSKFNEDFNLVRTAINNDGYALKHASIAMRNNIQIVEIALQKTFGGAIVYVGSDLLEQKETVASFVKQYTFLLNHLPCRYKNDKDIALLATSRLASNIRWFSKKLQKDKEVILNALKSHPSGWSELFDKNEIAKDSDFVDDIIKAVPEFYSELCWHPNIVNEEKIALTAVTKRGLNLRLVSDAFKNNKSIVKAAITQDPLSYCHASSELQRDWELIHFIISSKNPEDRRVLYHVVPNDLKKNKSFILSCIDINEEFSLDFMDPQFFHDIQVMLAVVRKNGELLRHASWDLRRNLQFVAEAVKQAGLKALECCTLPSGVRDHFESLEKLKELCEQEM